MDKFWTEIRISVHLRWKIGFQGQGQGHTLIQHKFEDAIWDVKVLLSIPEICIKLHQSIMIIQKFEATHCIVALTVQIHVELREPFCQRLEAKPFIYKLTVKYICWIFSLLGVEWIFKLTEGDDSSHGGMS